jgi:hypothetical protein
MKIDSSVIAISDIINNNNNFTSSTTPRTRGRGKLNDLYNNNNTTNNINNYDNSNLNNFNLNNNNNNVNNFNNNNNNNQIANNSSLTTIKIKIEKSDRSSKNKNNNASIENDISNFNLKTENKNPTTINFTGLKRAHDTTATTNESVITNNNLIMNANFFEQVEDKTSNEKVFNEKKEEKTVTFNITSKELVTNENVLQIENDFLFDETMAAKYSMKNYVPSDDMPKFSDDTEDVDEVQDCEHFDTRQSFLNLCQGNHYQFDQLRRAKHTSMMVLYHLHNPDAPKFVPTCISCHSDILVGNRHHCETCEIDFCGVCHSMKGGSKIHPAHVLRVIPIATSTPTQLTEDQRKERQRSIQLHMQLLQHAANCIGIDCKSRNCTKMKV